MKTDVLVIGGGLTGAATAYYLAGEGVEVALVEARDLNTQASGANAGSIHLQIPHAEFVSLGEEWARAYAPTLRLMKASLGLWQGLEAELGEPLGVKLAGGLLIGATEEEMDQIARKAAIERVAGIEVEIIGRDEIRALAPYLADGALGGAFCPAEGKADPLRAAPAFARAARRLGATILTGCEVEGLSRNGAFYVVHLRGGERIEARRVVNAAGASAPDIAAHLGLKVALQGFPIQVTVTEPLAPLIPHLVYSAARRLSAKQAANGTCLIGGGWPARRREDGAIVHRPESLTGNMATAAAIIPALAQARAVRSWTAVVNGTADWRPIIGEVAGHPGFFLALFPWMGFTAGPMTARLTADLVLGREPRMSLAGISTLADPG